jgi:hypothetical protein
MYIYIYRRAYGNCCQLPDCSSSREEHILQCVQCQNLHAIECGSNGIGGALANKMSDKQKKLLSARHTPATLRSSSVQFKSSLCGGVMDERFNFSRLFDFMA